MESALRIVNNETTQKILSEALMPRWDVKLREGLYFSPNYIQAVLIVFLLFLLVLTFARLRRMYVHWSLKGFFPSLLFGFLIALIVEGFLIIGGRTLFTELLGWRSAPKPIATALDAGREKLVQTLGVSSEIPDLVASEISTAESTVEMYQSLPLSEKTRVFETICRQ